MIAAVDTNVLLDLLVPGAPDATASQARLEQAYSSGALVVCEAVYAELAARFPSQQGLDSFLMDTGIEIEHSDARTRWIAGEAWRQYVGRRPRGLVCPSCGTAQTIQCIHCGRPLTVRQHVLADFMIGAHAREHADGLLTRDRGYYSTYFPDLRLL